jgi:hypothetical protein
MKSLLIVLLTVFSLLPSIGKAADLTEAVKAFDQLCHQSTESQSWALRYRAYQIYSNTFLQSAKEAVVKTNFKNVSTPLERLLDDQEFQRALTNCYRGDSEKRMHVFYGLMVADFSGKVAVGVSMRGVGQILDRVFARLAIQAGIAETTYNLYRLRMLKASIVSAILKVSYDEYQRYQDIFHPSKKLKKLVDPQMQEASKELEGEIATFQQLSKQFPNDPEVKAQLQVFIDQKAKFDAACIAENINTSSPRGEVFILDRSESSTASRVSNNPPYLP